MKAYNNIFFLGIGGIGMSALAQHFLREGKKVGGYDKYASEVTSMLESKGIEVTFKDALEAVLPDFLDKTETLIVFTKAIPEDSILLNYFRDHGFYVIKRSALLGAIATDSFCFAVAGSNGKTTTTSILTHILKTAEIKLSAFVGGIMRNYDSNFISEGHDVVVVEADEYDRSFLHLNPDIACITSMDLDHVEIYPTKEDMDQAFEQFTSNIREGGKLIVERSLTFNDSFNYGVDGSADFQITDIKVIDKTIAGIGEGSFPRYYQFDIQYSGQLIKQVIFPYLGAHNLKNALGATAMALSYGVDQKPIKQALKTFKGVERRFNFYEWCGKIVIDDYSHHPEGIASMYEAVREMFPNEKITALFQPHLYSRTQAFADDFAKALSGFDEVMLMRIYPAREEPIEGITSEWLLSKIKAAKKQCVVDEELEKTLQSSDSHIVLAMGAGSISAQVKKMVG